MEEKDGSGVGGVNSMSTLQEQKITETPASYPSRPFTLFVRYIPQHTTLDELKVAFAPFGEILSSTKILEEKRLAFIDFADEGSLNKAENAKIRMRNTNLRMERAKPRSAQDKPARKTRGSLEVLDESRRDSLSTLAVSSQASSSTTTESGNSVNVRKLGATGEQKRKGHPNMRNGQMSTRVQASHSSTIGRSLHMPSIPEGVSEAEIHQWMKEALNDDSTVRFRIVRNRNPMGLRQGFIDFANLSEAKKALDSLKATKLRDSVVSLELARAVQTPLGKTQTRTEAERILTVPTKPSNTPAVAEAAAAVPGRMSSPLKKNLAPKRMYYVTIPGVPPGTSKDDLHKGYIPFGKIKQITFESCDARNGESLRGKSIQSTDDVAKQVYAGFHFGDVESARKASTASGSSEVEHLLIFEEQGSSDVIVGPFPVETALPHIARLLSKFGALSGAKIVKQTVRAIISFENANAARRACEIPVVIRGSTLLGVPQNKDSATPQESEEQII